MEQTLTKVAVLLTSDTIFLSFEETESVKCIWYKVHLSDMCNDFRNESFMAMCKTFNLHCTSTLLQCVALDFMVRDAMAIVVTVLTLISAIILMDLA